MTQAGQPAGGRGGHPKNLNPSAGCFMKPLRLGHDSEAAALSLDTQAQVSADFKFKLAANPPASDRGVGRAWTRTGNLNLNLKSEHGLQQSTEP